MVYMYTYSSKIFFFQMIIGGKQHELDQITDKNYFSQSCQRDTNELYELISEVTPILQENNTVEDFIAVVKYVC